MKFSGALSLLLLGISQEPTAVEAFSSSSSSTPSKTILLHMGYYDHEGPNLTPTQIGPESMGGKAYGIPRKSIMTPKEEWWHGTYSNHRTFIFVS